MTGRKIPRPADRLEWLTLRKRYANASAAAVYMGCHPFQGLADLVAEKLSASVDESTNRAMERGNRLEAVVAEWWSDEHGIAVYEPDVLYLNGRLLATLDRGIVGNDSEAVEVKTTARRVGEVEDYWWWQAQAQMHCAELNRVHFAVLDGSMDLSSYVVERDDEAIDRLVEQVEKVWSFLELGMVPEGVQFSAEQVARLHPEPEPGSVIEVDESGLVAIKRWREANAARIAAEKAEKDAKDEVARILGEHEAAAHEGSVLLTWKSSNRSGYEVKPSTVRTLRPTPALEEVA